MKRFLSVLICLSFILIPSSLAYDISYYDALDEIGISKEMYDGMPSNKKAFYSNLNIGESVSSVTYYHSIDTLSTLNTLEEVSETDFRLAERAILNKDSSIAPALVNPDDSSGTWYEMETTVASVDDDRYSLVINLYVICDDVKGLLGGGTGYVAGGVNSLCSPISGSEVFYREITSITGYEESEYQLDAPHKGNGYGFDYEITDLHKYNNITMSFLFEELQSVNLIDGYGFAGYWDTVLSPSISISATGASLNISPVSRLVEAIDNHAQMRP